jgi:hypothetical protein
MKNPDLDRFKKAFITMIQNTPNAVLGDWARDPKMFHATIERELTERQQKFKLLRPVGPASLSDIESLIQMAGLKIEPPVLLVLAAQQSLRIKKRSLLYKINAQKLADCDRLTHLKAIDRAAHFGYDCLSVAEAVQFCLEHDGLLEELSRRNDVFFLTPIILYKTESFLLYIKHGWLCVRRFNARDPLPLGAGLIVASK